MKQELINDANLNFEDTFSEFIIMISKGDSLESLELAAASHPDQIIAQAALKSAYSVLLSSVFNSKRTYSGKPALS